MAIPPPHFDVTREAPVTTNVVEFAVMGGAYSTVSGVEDETLGEWVTFAVERGPLPEVPGNGATPAAAGPRPYDEVDAPIRVFLRHPRPGHRYCVHFWHGSYRFTLGEAIEREQPTRGIWEAPHAYRGLQGWPKTQARWREWWVGL